MRLKDIRPHFIPATQASVDSSAEFSHKVSRGILTDSTKTWIKKEMPNPAVAKIEIMAQEFFRLIIPHQPETRLLHDPSTGIHYILSEESRGYIKLPSEPHNYANGTYTGLGQVLVGSVFLQEIDLKNGNLGLDDQGRVIKIDGDWCFAEGRFCGGKYGLTPKMIASLPYPQDFYAFNWLDLIQQELNYPSSNIVSPALTNAKQFRDEVNQAMLKICILPDSFIEHFVDAYMPAGGERFVNLIKSRREELQASAQQNPSFQAYLIPPKSQIDARNLIIQMNSFVANGERVVPDHAHLTTEIEAMARFNGLLELKNLEKDTTSKSKGSKNLEILDKIYSNRVNDNDLIVIDYVKKIRKELSSALSEEQLLEIQHELNNVLKSVESPQFRAVKNAAQTLRDNNHWWTVGKEAKAKRIEQALAETPIEKRGDVITAKGPANKVQEAIASHRHLGYRGNIYKNGKNEIDFDKAANTFKNLKQKFFSEKLSKQIEQDVDDELKQRTQFTSKG